MNSAVVWMRPHCRFDARGVPNVYTSSSSLYSISEDTLIEV